jgi:hypothetical protein
VISTVASSTNRFIFHYDGQFFTVKMVKLSSLYEDQWPVDVFHQLQRDTLAIALQMGVSSSISSVSSAL